LYGTLNKLIGQRNNIIHYKSRISINDETLIDGKTLGRLPTQQEVRFLLKCYSLPDKLIKNLISYMNKNKVAKYLQLCGYSNDEIKAFTTK
jgi:hypothetical protein